jgi:hypothetical protein
MPKKDRPYSRFGVDPGEGRRFTFAIPLAIVLAIALSVLVFKMSGLQSPAVDTTQIAVANVRLERFVSPSPLLVQTPLSLPHPLTSRNPINPPPKKATLDKYQRSKRRDPAAPDTVGLSAPKKVLKLVFDDNIPSGKANVGLGPGTENGVGAADSSHDVNGSGSESGSAGAEASPDASKPCGEVDLMPYETPTYRGVITFERVRATVHFSDGRTNVAEFPYAWVYANEADDPWSQRNIRNLHFITRAKLPPSGTNEEQYPDLIRYILDHTRPDGTTVLQACFAL